MDRKKVLDLDKICRVCIVERKDMRPLFSEKVAEMLMDCTNVTVEPTEGWPDKICVQCVHSVSRCHAFKQLVERNDKELREYIKKLTVHVVIEETPTSEPPASPATAATTTTTLLAATPTTLTTPQLTQTTLLTSANLQAIKDLKLQQSQAKLLQLQQQQQALQKQQEQQQQARLLYEKQQQKALLKQQKQQQRQQQQQQLQQQQMQTAAKSKKITSNLISSQRRNQTQQEQPQQQQTQRATHKKQRNHHQATIQIHQQSQNQPNQQQQQQQIPSNQLPHQTQLSAVPIALTAAAPSTLLSNNVRQVTTHQTATQQQPQQTQQNQGPQLQTTAQLMPQQLVLPNGQIITAQILTHTGPPQIAQIINTAPTNNNITSAVNTTQHFAAPQLIQTTSGQTLQIIQQPNGQQTLQLVQLLPQRQNNNTATSIIKIADDQNHTCLLPSDDDELQHIDDDDDNDNDDDDEDEEVNTANANVGKQHNDGEQHIETIVVEEDQISTHLSPLEHDNILCNDAQELEYLEDVTVTTSTTSTGVNTLHYQHQQFLQDGDDVDEDYIIEEIPDENGMFAEETNAGDVMHGMGGESSEFISEDDDVEQQQQLMNEDEAEHEMQYAVMDDDDNALVEADVHEVFQAACDGSEFEASQVDGSVNGNVMTLSHQMGSNDDGSVIDQVSLTTTSMPIKRRKPTANNNNNSCGGGNGGVGFGCHARSAVSSRQLAATATRLAASAAAADDDFEIDAKLIADFIAQQTTSLSGGRYACNLCHQEFKQFKGLQGHMHQHSNWIRANCKKQPECEICFKSFKGPGMLRMHMKTHQSAARTPVCTYCGKTFKTKAILYRHRLSHRQLSFACAVDACRKTFSSSLTLKQHVERKHAEVNANTGASKYKCGECLVLFADIDHIESHVRLTGHGANGATSAAARHETDASSSMDDNVIILNSPTAGSGDVNVGDVLLVT